MKYFTVRDANLHHEKTGLCFFEYTKRIIFLGDKNMKRFFMRYGVVMIMICCLVFVILALSPARYPIANFSSRVYNTVNVAF